MDVAILIVWAVFWLGWLISAFGAKPTVRRRGRPVALLIIVAGVVGVYFGYSALMEERILTEQFPEAYPRYRERTKLLIPFLL